MCLCMSSLVVYTEFIRRSPIPIAKLYIYSMSPAGFLFVMLSLLLGFYIHKCKTSDFSGDHPIP